MGAWDSGPFDNDDASDWVWELEEAADASVLEEAAMPAAEPVGYLEAPTASCALAAAAAVLLAACTPATPCRRPAITPYYMHVDVTLTFTLPDSGGFIANGVPIPAGQLDAQLAAVFTPRDRRLRAMFVHEVSPRRCADLQRLVDAAHRVDAEVFDSLASARFYARDAERCRREEASPASETGSRATAPGRTQLNPGAADTE